MNIKESRRRFLYQNLVGVGGIALMELLHRDLFAAGPVNEKPLAPKPPHHTPKAKSCIFLSMLGGVAQMDTFDPKPALKKFDGTPLDWSKHKKTDQPGLFAKARHLVASPFDFSKHGKCGMDVSDLFPNLASCVDDMAFVRSVQADNGNHPAAVFQMNTGFIMPGNPSLGAWLSYGLGTMNQNLPAYVALPDFRSLPFSGSQQWGSARIDAYELSYRMQAEVPGVLSIDRESPSTKAMYGLDDPVTESFGKRCLMARKLVENGVRYVQIYTPSQSWDAHIDIRKNHLKNAQETDKPIAALDLKQRGLLETTLLVWMGEFGRTPDTPAEQKTKGRDHNPGAMTIWFAGGGVKAGVAVGATDELGLKAVEDVYHIRDVHATILHLMGLNDMRLTYYHAGRNRRLTDTGGKLIHQVAG